MARGEDGQALSLNLLFERPGNELYYSYGPGNRAPIAEYSGSWLILDGEGGAWDTPRQIKFTLYSRTDHYSAGRRSLWLSVQPQQHGLLPIPCRP